MNIYISSATPHEVVPSLMYVGAQHKALTPKTGCYASFETAAGHGINFNCHGVGVPGTIHSLTKLICTNSDISLLIQAGIAGVFDHKGRLEEVYNVSSDRFADLGAEDGEKFLSLEQLKLSTSYEHISNNGWLLNMKQPYPAFFLGLPQAKGITVNTVTGTKDTIARYTALYNATTESMEGAACHLCALDANLPFVQLRAASNYVQVRDKSQWRISGAIEQLNITLCQYLQTL